MDGEVQYVNQQLHSFTHQSDQLVQEVECVRYQLLQLGDRSEDYQKLREENGRHGHLEDINCISWNMRRCRKNSMKCQLNFAVLKCSMLWSRKRTMEQTEDYQKLREENACLVRESWST
ncbi:hypothetical protein CAEBREN_15019 [Caenorhabditis brenneri]|uniref:Uncharacterized protein n=1 Tax=Caenorhabditis brenneri TaxID=135651 RepID=G0NUC1_CAEBE|nr:hypothetical protein CAEBREN_15019 [Caenorhabditis brenneri]